MHAKAWVCLLIAACSPAPSAPAPQPQVDAFAQRLIDAGLERTRHQVRYDGSYRRIAYPAGDVPDTTGVCPHGAALGAWPQAGAMASG